MTLSTGAHTSKPCSPLRRARLVYHACAAANAGQEQADMPSRQA